MSFHGKSIVVTGAASGIGKEVVKELLEQGAIVHAIDLAPSIEERTETTDKQYRYPGTDVRDRQAVKTTFNLISERTSTLHGLVNCAGVYLTSINSAEGDDAFDKLMRINVGGTWVTNTEFYRSTKEFRLSYTSSQRASTLSIVNVGSMASVKALPNSSGYVASKHAVLGLTRNFAQDWGREGLRVNSVAPGAVRTPMVSEKELETMENSHTFSGAVKSTAEPKEIADTIIFLLSDLSSHISGQMIEINGGWP